MERIVHKSLSSYLLRHKLTCPEQHGFTSKRSCISSLLTFHKKITLALDRGNFVSCAFIDFSRAFDSIPHNLLLLKCESLGIQGSLLRWISSFLLHRTQSVRVGHELSAPFPVLSGVPQGTCLGPLLFSLYLSDISTILPPGVSFSVFADDLKLSTVNDTSLLQSSLNALQSYATSWGLTISSSKSTVMLLGKSHPPSFFSIDNNILPISTRFKDLGLTYTNALSFHPHVRDTIAKARSRCAYIHRAFSSRSPALYGLLFKVYIRPILEYGSELWNTKKCRDMDDLERVQAHYTRLCLRKCRLPYESYQERLQRFDLETLATRRDRIDLRTAYKITHNAIDIDPLTFFSFSTLSSRNSHNSIRLIPETCKTELYRNFFSNRVIFNWNKLSSPPTL